MKVKRNKGTPLGMSRTTFPHTILERRRKSLDGRPSGVVDKHPMTDVTKFRDGGGILS